MERVWRPVLQSAMNLRSIDLNLLIVFDIVSQERSVTRAAARLNMTQPAISHALARLRGALRDDLFIRTPDGMDPTPFAQRLAEPVQAALHSLRLAMEKAGEFDPATSEQPFAVAVDNRAAVALAAPIAIAATTAAPGICLQFRPSGTLNLDDHLDRGEIDLALTGRAATAERFSEMQLFEDGFVALAQRGHPAAFNGGISLEALVQYPHLTISSTGEDPSFVDEQLHQQGLARHITLHAPLLSAAAVLSKTPMLAIVGERIAREFALATPLEMLRLPFPTPRLKTVMLWHRRFDDVPAHRWLRTLVAEVARTVS